MTLHPDSSSETLPANPTAPTSRAGRMLRTAVGLALLAYVLGRADWAELAGLLGQVHFGWLIAFTLVTPVSVVLSVWKWALLLRARGHRPSFGSLFGLYVLSQFYNNVLPSSVGGDVVRVYLLGKRIHHPRDALGSVLVERFLGLSVLVIMGLVALALTPALFGSTLFVILALTGVGVYGLVVVAMFEPRLLRLVHRVVSRFAPARGAVSKLLRFQASLWEYRQHRGTLVASVLLSVAFHVSAILNVYLACRTLGQPVPFWIVAVATPLVLVITLLPISLNGVGLREWAFVVAFEALGVSGTIGLAASLLLRVKQMLWSSGGLLVHLCATEAPPAPSLPSRSPVGAAAVTSSGANHDAVSSAETDPPHRQTA
ncbi:MAG: lysylphosphatidylglycerol synthase transmembrane domain-containing protein [Phycisphaeraceae bacterium]